MNNIISTKARVFRNLKDYKFVLKLSNEQKEEISEKLSKIFSKFSLVSLSSADANVIKVLKNNNLISQNTNNVLLSKDENVSVNLFEEEHVTIVATSQGYDKTIFSKVKNLADELADKISLSYSDQYGYLMSDISKVGAGIKLDCQICLPSIKELNKIDQIKQNIRQVGQVMWKEIKQC